MYLLGYSLNNLSLMALTLSVGFVVDDAIVMLENIVRHMEMGESRMEAALAASREIGFTILSMTLLAGGGLHSGAVHGRDRGPAAARVFGHHRGGDSDFRLRLAEPHAHAGQPLSEIASTRRATAWLYRALEGGFNAADALVRSARSGSPCGSAWPRWRWPC